MTTLVIGARGSIGRAVLERLVAAGEPVRASLRDPAKADFPAGVPVVAADLGRAETLRAALDGVRKVFLYAPASGADAFIEAAREAGVEQVVLLSSGSVLLPGAEGNAIAEEHRAVERAFAGSGLRWTPIRPLVLAGNALNWAASIRAEGVARLFRPDAVTAPVHEHDIAAVAVAALAGKAGTAGILTGPGRLSHQRQVELVGRAIGREIRIEELTADQARRRFGPSPTVDAVLELTEAAAAGGSPATCTVEQVLGRPGRPFARWARDHAADFRG
ncbi:NAD(P)H-binding protein [Amycolatopsis sp. PS_44_ISF1]|uniref:NAD(P)H-binding protein n=1 Tax=Amycolatopsis sp. PS_44_ISF1 TaxID=2974917 RepID=UPI0028DF3B89|nr:NAD(P)H-binding protein [Amycolatopsis sp. PS_44_ISF1]MDT8913865.1 NAD(P)H-binding protein [Amycolatopsis sp. PS_44_ISF1]